MLGKGRQAMLTCIEGRNMENGNVLVPYRVNILFAKSPLKLERRVTAFIGGASGSFFAGAAGVGGAVAGFCSPKKLYL